MPAAPLVGDVTTRPPAAFSSLTAIANALTHSSESSGSGFARADNARYSFGARRLIAMRPGSVPSVRSPRSIQSCMADQMSSIRASTSSRGRQCDSLRSTSSAIVIPSDWHNERSDSPDLKGSGGSPRREPSSGSSSRAMKPPPSE